MYLSNFCASILLYMFGFGTLSGKMLLVRIIENDKIDAYFRSGSVNLWLALPRRVKKRNSIVPRRVCARNRKKKNTSNIFNNCRSKTCLLFLSLFLT